MKSDPIQNVLDTARDFSPRSSEELGRELVPAAMGITNRSPLKVLAQHIPVPPMRYTTVGGVSFVVDQYLARDVESFAWTPDAWRAHPTFFPYHRLLKTRALIARLAKEVDAAKRFADVGSSIEEDMGSVERNTAFLIDARMHAHLTAYLEVLKKALIEKRAPGAFIHRLDALIHPEDLPAGDEKQPWDARRALIELFYHPRALERREIVRDIASFLPPDRAIPILTELLIFEWMNLEDGFDPQRKQRAYGDWKLVVGIIERLAAYARDGYHNVIRRDMRLFAGRLEVLEPRLAKLFQNCGNSGFRIDLHADDELPSRLPDLWEGLALEQFLGAIAPSTDDSDAGSTLLEVVSREGMDEGAQAMAALEAADMNLGRNALDMLIELGERTSSDVVRFAVKRTLMLKFPERWNLKETRRATGEEDYELLAVEARADRSAIRHFGINDSRVDELIRDRLEGDLTRRAVGLIHVLATSGTAPAKYLPRMRELQATEGHPYTKTAYDIRSIERAVQEHVRKLIAQLLEPQMIGGAMMLSVKEIGELAPNVPAAAEEALPYLERLATVAQVMPQYLHLHPKITSAIGLIMRVAAR